MKQVLTTILCALLLSWGAASASFAATGWNGDTLMHDRLEREFRYYVPATLPENPPLVFLLHGGTRSMTKLFRKSSGASRAWPQLAEEEGFILVTPNGVNEKTGDPKGNRQNWNDCRATVASSGTGSTADDVGFIAKLIAWTLDDLKADATRVYVTGASNGGLMSYRLALELSDEIAAAAAFIANMPVENECRQAIAPVPMMIVNGTHDPLMPWNGGSIKGDRGAVLSAQATRDYWLGVNKADVSKAQNSLLPDLNKRDKSRVTRTFYPASPGGAGVLFYQVTNGGHTMPHPRYVVPKIMRKLLIGNQNRDFDSVRAAWEFLHNHQLKN